jgi:glycogen operon protein
VLSQVKLIAEPWDIGEGGYQVGNFPVLWTEWNGKYRDAVRSYWKGEGGLIGELAYRLTGSSDLYELSGRRPYASINFITCHDGFTLEDLVSYNGKHNEANLEDNRDGSDDNRSWNCGAEGPTSDPAVLALRARQKRNLLATLLLSQGVPMLLAGDETGRTQRGNNNAYCQDNEISWMSWNSETEDRELLSFVSELIKFRNSHPCFRRRSFFKGPRVKGTGVKDIVWLTPDGREMTDEEWRQSDARCLGLYLQGDATNEDDDRGRPVIDDDFVLLLNSHHEAIPFLLPRLGDRDAWQVVLDTARANGDALHQGAEQFPLQARSLTLLTRVKIGAVAAKIAEGVKLAASALNPAGR